MSDMSDVLIVNRHGVFHTVPEALLGLVATQGGRRATPDEMGAYESGQMQIGGSVPAVAPQTDQVAPWPDYDSLNVEQIVARLRNAAPEIRALALAYERQNKARRGVLATEEEATP